ncbi:MAG: prepilin-type N-terminal cleavage/methylation domain-containing protein [Pseudomonadota bacterium]
MAPAHNFRGFTLMEILTVLVLISIISVVIVNGSGTSTIAHTQAEFDKLKIHIRYVQAMAIGSSLDCQIEFKDGGYGASKATNPNPTPIRLPGEEETIVTPVSLTLETTGILTFNAFGDPGSTDFIVQTGWGNFIVLANTGYIQ